MNWLRYISSHRLIAKQLLFFCGLGCSVGSSALAESFDPQQIHYTALILDSAHFADAAKEGNRAVEASARAQLDGKMTLQAAASYIFSSYYVKNTDGVSEACTQQGISVSSYTRRFTELHASLLLISSKYVDLRQIPENVKIRIYNAARTELIAFAKMKNTTLSGACKEIQIHGYEMAEHATFANIMPISYRDLTTEPPQKPPKDPSLAYIERIARLLRFHIHFVIPADLQGNPASIYQVDLAPVGLIRDIKVIQASPLVGFDQAMIDAIRASEPFPKRDDGVAPQQITFTWRPKE